jgi:hypothetical protein
MRIKAKWIAATALTGIIAAIAVPSTTRFVSGLLAHDSKWLDAPTPKYMIAAQQLNTILDDYSLRVGRFLAEGITGAKASRSTPAEFDAVDAASAVRLQQYTQNVFDLEAINAKRIAAKNPAKRKPSRPDANANGYDRRGMNAAVATALTQQ